MHFTHSVLIMGGLMLLLFSFAASEEESIPESLRHLFPLANFTDSPPNCKPIKWLDTYENAPYVAMIKVVSSSLLGDGTWINTFKEELRFKGSNSPPHLLTPLTSLSRCDRYIIVSAEDGHISDCMGFAVNDGEVPTRALRFTDMNLDLLGKLYKWAKII